MVLLWSNLGLSKSLCFFFSAKETPVYLFRATVSHQISGALNRECQTAYDNEINQHLLVFTSRMNGACSGTVSWQIISHSSGLGDGSFDVSIIYYWSFL